MEEVISFYEIGDVLKKHLTLIITCLFLGIGLASLVTFFVLPTKYTASAKILVKLPTSDNTTVNDVDMNLRMINTYKEFIVTDTVTDEVKRRLASDYNYEGSLGEITVSQATSSQMFSISCKIGNPIEAETIANIVAEVFQETAMAEYTDQKISIFSPATANSTPVSPNHKTMILLGMIMGFFCGVGISFLINFFDKTVKEPRFVTETLDYAILGTVPQMTPKEISSSLIRNRLSLKNQIEDDESERRSSEKELPRVTRRTRGRL